MLHEHVYSVQLCGKIGVNWRKSLYLNKILYILVWQERAWSQAYNVHLVFLPWPNIPGSGLEISSLIGPFTVALVFPWTAFHECCLWCQILILLSVCWSLQLDQKWTDEERGGLRGGHATLHWGLNWGRGHSQGSFEYFPLGYNLLMWTLRDLLRLLTLSSAIWWGFIAALAFSPQVLQSAVLESILLFLMWNI